MLISKFGSRTGWIENRAESESTGFEYVRRYSPSTVCHYGLTQSQSARRYRKELELHRTEPFVFAPDREFGRFQRFPKSERLSTHDSCSPLDQRVREPILPIEPVASSSTSGTRQAPLSQSASKGLSKGVIRTFGKLAKHASASFTQRRVQSRMAETHTQSHFGGHPVNQVWRSSPIREDDSRLERAQQEQTGSKESDTLCSVASTVREHIAMCSDQEWASSTDATTIDKRDSWRSVDSSFDSEIEVLFLGSKTDWI